MQPNAIGSSFGNQRAAGSLIVHKIETAGNYTIQPIEIAAPSVTGSAAQPQSQPGQELNAYLASRNFKPIGADAQKFYVKPGAVFLAIRLKLNGSSARLRPLHITYKADRATFPLRLTHNDRSFDVRLYVLSKQKLADKRFENQKLDSYANNVLVDDLGTYSGSKPTPEPRGSTEFKTLVAKSKRIYIARFAAYEVNGPDNKVSLWQDDPAVSSAD